jgi:cytosine/adenosine deaminase-related metal-dependent hydrolase
MSNEAFERCDDFRRERLAGIERECLSGDLSGGNAQKSGRGPGPVSTYASRSHRYAYTRNSARAMNQQDSLGSIAPVKQSELILVDRDVLTVSPEELRNTRVI